jgi:hypothetical protein
VPVTRRDFTEICLRAMALPAFAASMEAQTYQPKFFDSSDFEALQSFTEILIPTDDTPGAREAHCAQFIDFVLAASEEDPKTQALWSNALATLRDLGFHAAAPESRERYVGILSEQQHPVFKLIKQLNTFAFYTSRAGQIETLDYRGMSYNATFPACTHPEHSML